MSKYLKLFETTADYTAAENTLVRPNVSLIEETNKVEYNPYIPFYTITYIGDGASPTKILLKYLNGNDSNYTLEESSILTMTLDDNAVSFNDFTLTNFPQSGVSMEVYTYTFNDENEHTLKIWTKSTDTFRFGVWYNGAPGGDYYGFSSIKDIVIPNGVTTIDDGAFCYCKSLTSITIPNSVTSIGKSTFNYCQSLTTITIPDSVTSIGDHAFYNCSSLTSVNIPNGVTSIGGQSFTSCRSLTSITIPNGVTSIGGLAFQGCSGLTSITIPNSVTSISMMAFSGCTKLTSVTVESTTPPSLESSVFGNNASGRKIYVPAASVNTYKSASGWRDYASDIEAIATT